MQLSAEKLPGSEQHVAFLYGPIVLSGELGRSNGLGKEDFWQTKDKTPRKLIPESDIPTLVAGENVDLTQHVKPVDISGLEDLDDWLTMAESYGFTPWFVWGRTSARNGAAAASRSGSSH